MKYFDLKLKNREQNMCGFRSDRDMFWATVIVIFMPVLGFALDKLVALFK